MKKHFLISILLFCFSVVYSQKEQAEVFFEIDSVAMGKISIRSLVAEKYKVWFAANEGRFGYHDFNDNTTFEKRIVFDSLKPEFRSMAQTQGFIFILSIANPALLYKIDKKNVKPKLIYRESHSKVFYDSMKFWNETEGIAVGDPTEDCFSLLITHNGGNSWNKMPCENLPKLADGEAAFAASNTNIVVKGEKCWIVSGGKKARVFFSPDKGQTWSVYDSPIVHGGQMTGIYTADFYDEHTGIIAGGNYDQPNEKAGNKAVTHDSGKTWTPISDNIGFGYASCIQFAPGSDGRELLCVGATGVFYSSDGGFSWQKILADKSLYTISFLNRETVYAAGKDKIIRIRIKK